MNASKGMVTYESQKGYWNGKTYSNSTIYINPSESGLKKDVNWKKSIKIQNAELSLIENLVVAHSNEKSNALVPGWNTPCPKCGSYCCGDCE